MHYYDNLHANQSANFKSCKDNVNMYLLVPFRRYFECDIFLLDSNSKLLKISQLLKRNTIRFLWNNYTETTFEHSNSTGKYLDLTACSFDILRSIRN